MAYSFNIPEEKSSHIHVLEGSRIADNPVPERTLNENPFLVLSDTVNHSSFGLSEKKLSYGLMALSSPGGGKTTLFFQILDALLKRKEDDKIVVIDTKGDYLREFSRCLCGKQRIITGLPDGGVRKPHHRKLRHPVPQIRFHGDRIAFHPGKRGRSDFDQHAMKARKKYYGNWFEITGALGETDMDGKYFYLESADKAIKCIIPKSTREKVVDKLTQAERGDIITVKGKVTDIGQSEYYEVTTADVYPNSSATTAASEEYDIASEGVSSRTVEHSGNAASEEADSKTASTTQDNGRDIHDEEEQKASDMTPEESSSTPAEDTKVFSYVDQMPIFPGGESALMSYIASNLKYPSAAQDQGIQGLVMLRFVVTGTGEVGEIQVLKSLDPSCDREAIRVVKSLPRFTPGRKQGQPVNVWFQLPIRFELR